MGEGVVMITAARTHLKGMGWGSLKVKSARTPEKLPGITDVNVKSVIVVFIGQFCPTGKDAMRLKCTYRQNI